MCPRRPGKPRSSVLGARGRVSSRKKRCVGLSGVVAVGFICPLSMTASEIAAIQSTLRAVSTNASASSLTVVPRRSTSSARLRPGTMGELDTRQEALPRVQRVEISALGDANHHGFLAREPQSEGKLHPRPLEGRLPSTAQARHGAHDTRPPLTPSGALIHEHLQRERASIGATSRPGTSSAAPVGRSRAGQRRPQSALAMPWLPASMASDESARLVMEPHGVRPSSSQPLLGQTLQQQAPGLRISKAAAHAGGGLPPPPSVPSNRSEAVRLQPHACSRMPATARRRRACACT